MKKIFTILCLMALTMGAQAQSSDYSGIEISFNKSAATEANFTNVSVVVKDLDGNVLSDAGVTAEAVSQEGGELVNSSMGNVAALSWTTGSIIGARFNNNNYPSGNSSNYVVKISGLRSGFTYNKADVDVYGVNRTGGIVNNSAVKMSLGIQTGNSVENLSDFVSSTDNTIHDGSQEGGLMHKISSMISSTTKTVAEGEDLYVKVTIQKTADNSTQCRPCFRTVKLSQLPMVSVTYKVVDENETTLTTKTESVESGTSITSLPASMQHTLFYDYSTENYTATEGLEATFTATPKAGAPLQFTADTSAPVWYYLKNQGNNSNPNGAYPTYVEGGDPNVTLPTANAENATTSWAFIGNPYSGFQIVNEAAGTNLVLGSDAAGNNDNNGGNTYATLGTGQDRETWTIEASSYATNGFFIRNADGHALNFRSNANLAYWTSGADKGSTFVATKVPEPDERYQQLIALLETYLYGTGLGQYSLSLNSEDKTAQAGSLISDLKAAGYTAENYTQAQAIQAGTSLNMPQANTFLRIKSVVGDKAYLKAADAGATMTFSTTADASTIFCYIDGNLVAYQNGLAVNEINKMGTAGGDATTTFTFKEGLNGAMSTYSLYGGENAVLYSTGTNGSNADWFNTNNQRDKTTFTLEEVPTLPITLRTTDNTNYFATFSAPVNVRISGASLNTVTNNNKTAAYNTVDTDMLKAGVGVLLSGTSATATATIITEDVADADYGLVKYYAATAGTGDESKLYLGKGKTSGKAGFYKLGEGTTSNGFKAYLSNTTVMSGAKEGLELEFAGVTGIENMEHGTLNMENGAVYNLQGQRVNKAQKGVYIINNKKVVVK